MSSSMQLMDLPNDVLEHILHEVNGYAFGRDFALVNKRMIGIFKGCKKAIRNSKRWQPFELTPDGTLKGTTEFLYFQEAVDELPQPILNVAYERFKWGWIKRIEIEVSDSRLAHDWFNSLSNSRNPDNVDITEWVLGKWPANKIVLAYNFGRQGNW